MRQNSVVISSTFSGMEAAAATAAAFRPSSLLAPPNRATSKWRRPPPSATTVSSTIYSSSYNAHNLARKPRLPCRCSAGNPSSPSADLTSAGAGTLPLPGLVLDVGSDSSWDSHTVGSPVVKRFVSDDKERWLMWYHGSPGGEAGDSIGLAVSNNGIHWERGPGPVPSGDGAGQVMSRSDDWWAFDTWSLRPAEVLVMSSDKLRGQASVYWMYYTGFTQETIELPAEADDSSSSHPWKALPGLAISQDGRHWARIEGEHHSGALFDAGADGEWDSLFIAAPNVVYHGRGDLRMYYHSLDRSSGRYAVGIARSRDGIRWVKLGKVMGGGADGVFDEMGVRNAHVVSRSGGGYLMVYEGVAADGRTSIGMAASPDGLKEWRRCGEEEAVLRPSEGEDGWDCRGVCAPCLVQMDGGAGWRLYYRGFGRGGRMGIGLAVSQDYRLGSFEFKRWKGSTRLL